MAPLISKENEAKKEEINAKLNEQTSPNDSPKRVEKAQKMKEQILNAQAQGSGAVKPLASVGTDMRVEEKQNKEKFFEWTPPPPPETMGQKLSRKVKENPFVPVGALATVGALTYGLFSFVRGDTRMQQLMMRARVAAQGGTIVAVAGGVVYMLFRDHQDKKGQR